MNNGDLRNIVELSAIAKSQNNDVSDGDSPQRRRGRFILLHLIVVELKEYFRNIHSAFWTFIYPMIIVFFLMLAFGGTSVDGGIGGVNYGTYLVCGMLAINVLSMGFFGFGISFIEARNRGSFKMYQTFPIWKFSYIFSFICSRVLVVTLFSLFFLCINNLMYGLGIEFTLDKFAKLILVIVFTALAFIAMTFSIVSFIYKTATATAILNVLFYPLMIFSDLFVPKEAMMEELAWIGSFSPVSTVAVSIRSILIHDAPLSGQYETFGVLLLISIISMFISVKTFKFRSK